METLHETAEDQHDLLPAPKRPGIVVLSAGLATGALSLLLQYVLETYANWNFIGLYANGVLPLGAVALGVLAGSGYGIASWTTGAKISGRVLVAVFVLQCFVYFSAHFLQYVAFCNQWQVEPGFFAYFDAMTRSIAWNGKNGQLGEPLEAWGYGLRALELAGFTFGAIIIPMVLGKQPYCDRCRAYMRTAKLAALPVGVKPRSIPRRNVEAQKAFEEEATRAGEYAQQVHDHLVAAATASDVASWRELIRLHAIPEKDAQGLTSHMVAALERCPKCDEGVIRFRLTQGTGKQATTTEVSAVPVGAPFVRELLA